MEVRQEITKVLFSNYLPYAKSVIIDRAIPSIDGLKPSHRKILYTMYSMHLLNGNKVKSANIVGQTMKLNPHGDQAIYDTMVRLSTGNESLNVPYIESKGNFGKVYSSDLAYAASRYTEAKLHPICAEIFDGIDEDAVDFQDNYDGSMQEPTLLPTKFPTILANPSNGIAVGMGCSIPSYGLKNCCNAIIGLINGTVKDTLTLTSTLGIPEFPTGGNVHASRADLEKIVETGSGQVIVSGLAKMYPNKIVITELPYKVTVESVISSIEEKIKEGILSGISDVSDETDLKGFKMTVYLKNRANPQEVLTQLYRHTPLRSTINFNTRIIVNNQCKAMGLMELLNSWLEFRISCINRVYSFRLKKERDKEYYLSAWEKIQYDIREVARLIADKTYVDARTSLMENYKLTAEQADYLLDMKIKEFTNDRLSKNLYDLSKLRESIAANQKVVDSREEKLKIIVLEQTYILNHYGRDNKSHVGEEIDLEKEREERKKIVIDDSACLLIITKNGLMKRMEATTYYTGGGSSMPAGEEELYKIPTHGNEHLLIFGYDGVVRKLPVHEIDSSRGKWHDMLRDHIGMNMKDILFIDASGDYSKSINIVYDNGRGNIVNYSKISGKRSKYINVYEPNEIGRVWVTTEDKFFIITRARKASYCDLSIVNKSKRSAFKVANINDGDYMVTVLNTSSVPDIEAIDLNKYSKPYTVTIGPDELWQGANKQWQGMMKRKAKESTAE